MHTQFSRISTVVMLLAAITLTSCATRTSYTDLYGIPVPANGFADYSLTIGPNTKYVNVVGGEIVRFVVNDKSFIWHFMVARTIGRFDLKEVAPAGILDHSVIAYVKPDPRYMGVP
ncbi:MAG TPA: CzcE family metal-binding protein [Burkholderiaceae bacterium]|nr:CzcE family metal-binding protein [Burkholderiaceae bacterium]